MASARVDISGDWFGMMVHQPSRALIRVTFFDADDGSFEGEWDLTRLESGGAKKGKFKGTRFANLLEIVITNTPLKGIRFQLTIFTEDDESMITGVIPLEDADIPFATITLFREKLSDKEMDGICPVLEFRPKG